MYLSKDKRQDINNQLAEKFHKTRISLSDSLGGTGIKKDVFVFCELTELTNTIETLTALRDIIEKETGFRF